MTSDSLRSLVMPKIFVTLSVSSVNGTASVLRIEICEPQAYTGLIELVSCFLVGFVNFGPHSSVSGLPFHVSG